MCRPLRSRSLGMAPGPRRRRARDPSCVPVNPHRQRRRESRAMTHRDRTAGPSASRARGRSPLRDPRRSFMMARSRSHPVSHPAGQWTSPTARPPRRLASIDAYRGFVMFLMMAEVLHLGAVAKAIPGSALWEFLGHHQTHVEWVGCSLHDLIQPSFSFLVGVALPFSLAGRLARGQSTARMTAARVLAGVGPGRARRLPPVGRHAADQLHVRGHAHADRPGLRASCSCWASGRRAMQWVALGGDPGRLLGGVRALSAAAGPDFDYAAVGVPADWPHHSDRVRRPLEQEQQPRPGRSTRWFLNLFPRAKPFAFNGGGYATLSFIPTLGTMILGLIAGGVLRRRPVAAGRRSAGSSSRASSAWRPAGCWASSAICPVVKRIWTPSWVLFSGGWCFLFLAAFYAVVDVLGVPRLGVPAGRDRDELDRRLLHGPPVRRLHRAKPRRRTWAASAFQVLGASLRAAAPRARPCCWCSG